MDMVGIICPLVSGDEIPVNIIEHLDNNKYLDTAVFYNVATRGTFNQLSLAMPGDVLVTMFARGSGKDLYLIIIAVQGTDKGI